MAEPDVTQIVAGAGLMFVAPLGSAMPAIDELAPVASEIAFSQAAGGALSGRTIFVKISGLINGVESAASAEVSFAALANNLVTVTFTLDNREDAQYDHIHVYASTTTGAEVKQTNGTNLLVTAGVATWTEPVTGVAGAGVPPTSIASGVYPVAWPAAWKQVGYTDDGIDLAYTPTVKDINVDETPTAVAKLLTAEKAVISAKLAEATLLNLSRSISAAKFADDTAAARSISVKIGTGNLSYVMVGIQAPAPGTNLVRIIVMYKAICQAAVNLKMQRKDKVVIPVQFEGLADSNKPLGEQLLQIVDITP
jgi:hypothetical protein